MAECLSGCVCIIFAILIVKGGTSLALVICTSFVFVALNVNCDFFGRWFF